jgi:alpha-glucosidase/alpha-D-xyloside xylohydrolase
MADRVSRRDALKQLSAAGAGAALAPRLLFQTGPITVDGRPVEVSVLSMSAMTVRLIVTPLVDGTPSPLVDDGVLEGPQFAKQARPFRTAPLPAIDARDLVVRFNPFPPAFVIQTSKGAHVQTLTLSADAPTLRFTLPRGPLLGLGEGGPQFDRKGSTDRMRSGQGGYQLRTHGGRVPIQWMVGTDGWGLYIHQPLGTFDFTGAEGVFTHAANATPLDVFVVASSDPAVLMREYARITGLAEMPPLWSFGYLQSHRTLGGPEEVLRVARTFREKKLPCDALIYLGTDFTPSGWNTHNGQYEWNPKNFPDPKKMIDDLHALNYKIVLHTVIEGRRFLGKVSDPCTAPPIPAGRNPPAPPDRAPTNQENPWPPERQASCYWPSHKPLFDLGIDGFWPDQGDGYDAPSRLARIRAYYEGSQLWRPNQRVFALHRNGYAGMQRFAAFLWSGDVFTTWETLKTHVPVAVNTGLSGIPFWGTDIGGFVPTREYTGELHVRWFQFGAFNTLFRAHGRNWHLRLPWGWNLGTLPLSEINPATKEAADPDPSELNNPHVEPICRTYLELRYRLMPYLYSAVRECCLTGMPVLRALWLHYPDDPAAAARGDQYLWGRDMLVAPVVEQGAKTRTLYLPRGVWYDFWTNKRETGGREIDRAVDLETMPLYVGAGAIIPMGPLREYTSQAVDGPLSLTVYPGAEGSFTIYEDDGRTFDYRKGAWMGIVARWRDADRRLSLSLAPGSRMLAPARRPIEVRIAGTTTVHKVTFEGEPIDVKL